jgi:hypothetical protein
MNLNISRGEILLRMYLKRILPNNRHYYNVRNLGIINKNTNAQLEIDIYIPALKLGFEFNGKQHHYEEQKLRDKIKKDFCKKNNITLITIWTNTLDCNLFEYLSNKYPEIPFIKPSKEFLRDFNIEVTKYKKIISKMNKKIKNNNQFIKFK